jgi:hypothetical protein
MDDFHQTFRQFSALVQERNEVDASMPCIDLWKVVHWVGRKEGLTASEMIHGADAVDHKGCNKQNWDKSLQLLQEYYLDHGWRKEGQKYYLR